MSVSVAASTRNWKRISRRVAPSALRDADFPGALGDRDHHDRHHADAAHHEAHAGQGEHHQEESAGELLKVSISLSCVTTREVVLLAGPESAAARAARR